LIPKVKANGAEIPVIGLGTWRSSGGDVVPAVHAALDVGYRHIDTAVMYSNEVEVGEANRTHSVPRSEIFLTTKIWPDDVARGQMQAATEASLKRLGVDQVDLLLIHWPSPDVPLRAQIEALCKTKRSGLTRHIGVSNFPPLYIEEAARVADEPIVANQVEYHPYLDQSALFEVCRKHGIVITAYCPLGRSKLLRDPVVARIAAANGKTPAQVLLRWHVQQPNNIAIPKSSNPERIAENFAIFDFALAPDEMAAISGLARPDGRMVDGVVALDWNGAPPT